MSNAYARWKSQLMKASTHLTNTSTCYPNSHSSLRSSVSFASGDHSAKLTIDDHILNFQGHCSAGYAVLPDSLVRTLEHKIYNAAQFVAAALVPFILDDTMQFVVSPVLSR